MPETDEHPEPTYPERVLAKVAKGLDLRFAQAREAGKDGASGLAGVTFEVEGLLWRVLSVSTPDGKLDLALDCRQDLTLSLDDPRPANERSGHTFSGVIR